MPVASVEIKNLPARRHRPWQRLAGGLDAADICEAEGGDAVAQATIHGITKIGQHDAGLGSCGLIRMLCKKPG